MTHDTRIATRGIYKVATDAIGAAASTSTGIDKSGFRVVGVILPAITSGSVGFHVSTNGSTWAALHDPPGTAVNLGTTTGSCAVSSSPFDALAAWPWVRLTFGAAASLSAASWTLLG